MLYSNIIHLDEKFQTSVNLNYDQNDINKVRAYIPTKKSVEILKRYLMNLLSGESAYRANILIGPYGRGKSHLILVLFALIWLGAEHEDVVDELIEKLGAADEETAQLARAVRQNYRLMPVVIDSSHDDLTQAMIVAMKDALERIGEEGLLPDTYFDAAAATVELWKNEYQGAYSAFERILGKYKLSADELRIQLLQYNTDAYRIFTNVYPQIAAGSEFNPMVNTSVVKLYSSINEEICKRGIANGIYIVFDEFGKYLESNTIKAKPQEFKMIQDLAELAARSKEAQLHFTCITHKEIREYSGNDTFMTVEGRFKSVPFVVTSEQSYELIINAIEKKDGFDEFVNEHRDTFNAIKENTILSGLFSELTDEAIEELIIKGCFPINPITTYCMIRVSERTAQNERTLFTFIAQNDKHSVYRFVNTEHDGLEFVTLDVLYDYYKSEFKKHKYGSHKDKIFEMYSKAENALKKAENELQRKIIKSIAVIGIVNDDRLRPVAGYIRAAVMADDASLNRELENLEKSHVLYHQQHNSHYVFLTPNGIDVNRQIQDRLSARPINYNRCELLENICCMGSILPRRYNDEYSMIRYFRNVYIEANTLCEYVAARQLLERYPYDGVVLNLLYDDEETRDRAIATVKDYEGYPNIVLCVNDEKADIEKMLQYYAVIQEMKQGEAYAYDEYIREELELYESDYVSGIDQKISEMFSPQNVKTHFYNCNGELTGIAKEVNLNRTVSEICEQCYNRTPIINNELINKKNITAPVRKARAVLNDILLNAKELKQPEGYGPEVSLYRAMIKEKGLDEAEIPNDEALNAVLDIINGYAERAQNNITSFSQIFDELGAMPIGMRRNVIPVYLAYVFRRYKSNIVIYFGRNEEVLSADILEKLTENPSSYSFATIEGTNETEQYLNALQTMFAEYEDAKTNGLNRVNRIVYAMQTWMRSKSKFTKNTKTVYPYDINEKPSELDTWIIRIKNELLRFKINANELLLRKIPHILGAEVLACIEPMQEFKEFTDAAQDGLNQYLIRKTKQIFTPDYSGSLTQSLKQWYNALSEQTKIHIFDTKPNELMKYISTLDTYNEDEVISSLAQLFTMLDTADWKDEIAEDFIIGIKAAKVKIEKFNAQTSESGMGADEQDAADESVITIRSKGKTKELSFAEEEISGLGQTVLNGIASIFDDYGDAIPNSEKISILMKALEELTQ